MEINKPQNAANQASQFGKPQQNAPKQAVGTQRPGQEQGGLGRKEQGKNPYNKPSTPINPKSGKSSNLPPR